jgi:transcriptional regulator with AbiEi antitoxin domain of type IV toxin-antitoxin system
MLRISEFKKETAERLRGLFPQAAEWQESLDATVGDQTVDLLVRFRMGQGQEIKTLICETRSRGEPRYLREAITRLRELRAHLPGAYPMVAAPYISPQSAALIHRNGCGYIDLAGNCSLAFDSVLIQKEGRPNVGLVRRPLRTLFAPRATRVVRALLAERERAWRLDELGRAVSVSLGHAHNVIKRLEELDWVERARDGLYRLHRPGDLLDGWRDAYSYRVNGLSAFVSPTGDKRRAMETLARHATELGMAYAFTLHAGASLIGPHARVSTVHAYVNGDVEALARVLGLQPVEGEGSVYLMAPYDPGVFYAPVVKGGFRVVSLPQLYVDLHGHERRGREQAEKLRRDAMGF